MSAAAKIHGRKALPGNDNRAVAICWEMKPGTILTGEESEVTCKKCLNSIAFYRHEEAEWQKKRRAEKGGGA